MGLARGRWRVGGGEDAIRVFVEDSERGALVRFEQGSGPIGIPFSKVDELAALVAAARGLIEAATSGTLGIAARVAPATTAVEGTEEGFSLDREKLSALRAETAEVAAFLAQVFQEDVEEITEEAAPRSLVEEHMALAVTDISGGVPHREWVKTLAAGPALLDWDVFEASARAHGISFVDAAMEEINTYVLEASGDFGLSGNESVEVNTKMLAWVL